MKEKKKNCLLCDLVCAHNWVLCSLYKFKIKRHKEKEREKWADLVTKWDVDNALDSVLEEPLNGTEPALAYGAAGLDLGPLHDAEEAEVMVAAIDFASDRFSTVG